MIVDTFLDNAGRLIKSHPDKDQFHYAIAGAEILRISRRGKWILMDLTNLSTVVVNLGMFGSITMHTESLETTCIVLYLLADGVHEVILNYDDEKRWGSWYCWPTPEAWKFVESRTGPEAMFMDDMTMGDIIRSSKASIVEVLTNQKKLSGIGNIYRSEILNLAQVSPFMKCGPQVEDLTIARITTSCCYILQLAVQLRGSSIADYVDGYGNRGSYAQQMLVYGRGGEVCKNVRCGGVIQHRSIGGRSLYWCVRCQQ